MAVQDGPIRHLFDNTGDLYYGGGFEMLATLEANFKPAAFSHTFATLLSLINDKQSEEGIHEFRARFGGHIQDMSRSAVSIPPILKGHALFTGTSSLLQINHWHVCPKTEGHLRRLYRFYRFGCTIHGWVFFLWF